MVNSNLTLIPENQPLNYSFFYSSFFNPKIIQPVEGKNNLIQLKQHHLTVRIETNLEKCHELFEISSPKKNLFELWGFRYAFYLGYQNQPVFLIFEKGAEIVGLLPLWYEKETDELRWFGSWWQEGNTFWIKNESLIPTLLALFPRKILLNGLNVSSENARKWNLVSDDPKYLLSLEQYPSVEAFLQKFNKKKRYNLRRDQKIILAKNPQTVFNRFSDIEKLFKLSIKRFRDPDDLSSFIKKERKDTFREIINQAGEYEARIITTEIDSKVVGVDLAAIYKGVYYALSGAYDLKNHPGLGNYTNLLLIQDALNLGMKAVDFLEVSYDWKEDWFEPVPLFQYKGSSA